MTAACLYCSSPDHTGRTCPTFDPWGRLWENPPQNSTERHELAPRPSPTIPPRVSVSARELPHLDRPAQEAPALFSCVVGLDAEREIALRALGAKEPVHVLFVGPPATAKSLMLEEINRAFPGRCWFADGTSTRKAGLVRLLFERRPSILLLDEIEKAKREDLESLLTVMEGGRLTETKTGRTYSTTLPLRVFAAANSRDGLPAPLLSRFVEVTIRPYTEDETRQVMERILVRWERADPGPAAAVVEACLYHGLRDVRDARKVWRMLRPGEHPEAVARLLAVAKGPDPGP